MVTEDEIFDEVVTEKVKEFLQTENWKKFRCWMEEQVEKDQPTLLHTNPPNKIYDLEDGTFNLVLTEKLVALSKEQCSAQAAGLWAFKIDSEGSFREVLSIVGNKKGNDRLEASMAFYNEGVDGFLSNSKIWQSLAQTYGTMETVENPFYRGVCLEILNFFQEKGWI